MSLDVKAFEEFRDKLEKVNKASDEIMKQAIIEIAARALRLIKNATPVDTGFLKEDWFISNMKKTGNVWQIDISNLVEYAPYVEYGHRIVARDGTTIGWQEGQLMMTLSMKAVEKRVDQIVQRNLNKYFAEAFK